MKDLFAKQAAEYAKQRPRYPAELLDFVVSLAPARDLAWDCATGSGQAAAAGTSASESAAARRKL